MHVKSAAARSPAMLVRLVLLNADQVELAVVLVVQPGDKRHQVALVVVEHAAEAGDARQRGVVVLPRALQLAAQRVTHCLRAVGDPAPAAGSKRWPSPPHQYRRMAMSKRQVRRISITSNSRASVGGNTG
jgi:hypothetical protein